MPNRLTELTPTTQGLPTASGTQVLRGIFRTLTSEHRDLVRLLKELAASDNAHFRAARFAKAREELMAHELGEMQVLYPPLRSQGLTYGVPEQHSASVRKLEVVVDRLSGYSFDHPEWTQTGHTLVTILEQHVEEEETQFFALAQEAIGAERAEELDEQYEAFKAEFRASEQGERAV